MGNRVLVVDDEKLIVKGLKFSLEQEGLVVDCAYDGEEAVAAAVAELGVKSADEIEETVLAFTKPHAHAENFDYF